MLEGVLAIECVLLGLVPLPGLDHHYVDRRLLTGVRQIVQHFSCHFLPMVPEVFNIYVLAAKLFWVFSCVL